MNFNHFWQLKPVWHLQRRIQWWLQVAFPLFQELLGIQTPMIWCKQLHTSRKHQQARWSWATQVAYTWRWCRQSKMLVHKSQCKGHGLGSGRFLHIICLGLAQIPSRRNRSKQLHWLLRLMHSLRCPCALGYQKLGWWGMLSRQGWSIVIKSCIIRGNIWSVM